MVLSQSELELDAQIKFIDGMSSSDIQDALIKQQLKKLILMFQIGHLLQQDFFFDLYHRVGKSNSWNKR